MKNPLRKRIVRNLKGDIVKYLLIFLFMTVTTAFISGFLVAGGSMKQAYDDSFEKYNIENGHFVLEQKANQQAKEQIEKENVKLYEDFYLEEDTETNGNAKSTLRIFKDRKEVNKVCLMKGDMPKDDQEIAIDRMYADNNKVKVGDEIKVNGKNFKVSGLVALSDYSALFSDTSDLMFDAVKFGTAILTDQAFDAFGDTKLHYSYEWKYEKEPKDDAEEKKVSEDLMVAVAKTGCTINKFVPRYANTAITFTGDDIGGDRVMMTVLMYILLVILAFVFAVTINHTITKEATVIGTLRASGYTKGELLRQYLASPILITLASAVVGNILGYTVCKGIVANMYYGSYSLPTYTTIWNADAFVLTTIIPILIMFVVNAVLIWNKLSISPLRFIRRDLSRKAKKKAMRLPKFKFFHRFRLRILFQNIPSYITLFIGIIFANVILMFGMMMNPLLDHYQEDMLDHMTCSYQYLLKAPVETENKQAEKFAVTSLKTQQDGMKEEEISAYGIFDHSKYVKDSLTDDGVYVTEGYAEKYRRKVGDKIQLKDAYGDKKYEFEIKGISGQKGSLSIYMPEKEFTKTFDEKDGYYNGYFSNEKLKDVDEKYVASIITKDDMTKVSRQLKVSMGDMFQMVNVFAVVLFAILMYLLTKLVIEKNSTSISMVKILGYSNKEISSLYQMATTWAVIISILLSLLVVTKVLDAIYWSMMKEYSGWLTLYISKGVYVKMVVIGILVYAFVAVLQYRKIRKIPMDEALKNVE